MKKTLLFALTVLAAMTVVATAAQASEETAEAYERKTGWCGGVDAAACCAELGLETGACHCACVSGQCFCGPGPSTDDALETLTAGTRLTAVEVRGGRVVALGCVTRGELSLTSGGPEKIDKGDCCAHVHAECVSCCNKDNGCTGFGDCDTCEAAEPSD